MQTFEEIFNRRLTRSEIKQIRDCPYRVKYRRNSAFFCKLHPPVLTVCRRQRL